MNPVHLRNLIIKVPNACRILVADVIDIFDNAEFGGLVVRVLGQ
jgi:hypothetical protein